MNKIRLIGAAIDACASTLGSADTPDVLNKNMELAALGLSFTEIFRYNGARNDVAELKDYFTAIAESVHAALKDNVVPLVVGGDHSCAIGTWSGVAHAQIASNKTFGLIWIDAHMDSHTPETTPTGNIHGMPIATLFGHGYKELISILDVNPKLKPENVILIGIRSYEEGEAQLLDRLGVQIYYSTDVRKHGIQNVFTEAWNKLASSVDKVGLSIDLDGFDPEDAPGVGTSEPDGVNFALCLEEIAKLSLDKLVAVEVTEGNDHLDPSGKTMQCVVDIIKTISRIQRR